jgi:type II secretory pathway component PulK
MKIYRNSSRSKGAVLFMVLGIVFLMSILVTLFLELSLKKMREQAVNYAIDDLRPSAYSALEVVLGVLASFQKVDGSLTGPAQGWGDPLAYSEVPFDEDLNISVKIEDETGKFSLTMPNPQYLYDVFMAMGFDLSEAETLYDSLQDWIDPDDLKGVNGAEKDEYEREDPPYKPPNRPIASFSELRYIHGFKELFFDEDGNPNEKYELLVKATSLHNTAFVNVNTAPAVVWALFSEMNGVDLGDAEAYAKGDDGIAGTADDRVIDPSKIVSAKWMRYDMDEFKVIVDVSRGDSHFILNALVEVGAMTPGAMGNQGGNPSIGYPFTIKCLSENKPIE